MVEFHRQYLLRGAFVKGNLNTIGDLTCKSYQIVTDTSRSKDWRYHSNLIKFELLLINNKSDNRNVGRIISAALANQSNLLPSTCLETEECRNALFGIYYNCMRKLIKSSINQWIDKDGNVELYLHTYLSQFLSMEQLTAFRELPAALINQTPITENFHNIVIAVFRSLLFVKSEFDDENDTEVLSNWYQSTLQTESWLKRKSAKKKADFVFDISKINFSNFSKLLRKEIRNLFARNKKLQTNLLNTLPLKVIS